MLISLFIIIQWECIFFDGLFILGLFLIKLRIKTSIA